MAGATCTNTFPFSVVFSGGQINTTLTSTSGPSATATVELALQPEQTPAAGAVQTSLYWDLNIATIGCNAGEFSGTLNKQ